MKAHNCQDCKIKSAATQFLTPEEFKKLEVNSAEVDFKKGDIIFKQNALSLNVVYLRTGLVKVHMQGPSKEKILRLVKAPSYLGIPTTFGDKINNYSVTALEDTTVCFIDASFFKMLTYGNGQFAYEIIIELCKNELFDQQRSVNQEQKQIPGRVAETILCMSDSLFKKDTFNVPLSRNEFADLIGTSRESLSRILNQFSCENIIKIDGSTIEITDKNRLEKICQKG
jgi:CRP-like cAMP-binding protein